MRKITIAIDGHSSCGKSTMAKALARELGYVYVDTGAMYRSVTLFAMRNGLIAADGTVDVDGLQSRMDEVEVSFRFNPEAGKADTYLNGENVEREIRSIEVSNHVSPIAAIPFVREAMVDQQRRMGKDKGIVMDGRDIGTTVFPDAELKIFVTASAAVRAQRRYDELQAKGMPADYDEILRNVEERDYIDSHREVSPLKQADDALLLDNSNMTIEEQNEWLREKVTAFEHMTLKEIMTTVAEGVKQLCEEREPRNLYDPVAYALSAGGKRIRPVLALTAYDLYKDNPESILKPALGIETYHNFTLLHDDLMDKADVRRGRPTVHKRWDDNTAILSGDTMLVLAYQRVAECDDSKLRPVLDLFTKTALEIGEGQQYDMDFEQRNDVTEAEYIEMIRLKTAVLLACSLKMGAILAGASAEDQEALYDLGVNLGLAFQLQDDYLDVYGDENVFGKAIGGDICNNKKTYMLINAQLRAQGYDKAELERWLAATEYNKEEKIAAVTAIYNRLGIDKLAMERIDEYMERTMECLARIGVADERKSNLREIIAMMNKRES